MAKYFPLPNGDFIKVPDSMTYDEANSLAQRDYPELFKVSGAAEPKGGFMPALKAGISGLKSDVAALAGKTGIMDEAAAEKYIAAQKEYQQKTFKPTEEGWTEAPGTKIKELLGGSLPYMAAPIAAGAVAPAGAAALGATGLASLAQFTGSNLSRQMDEGKTLKQAELGSAALAAIPQAALDVVSFKMLPGVRGIFGEAGVKMTNAQAKAFTEQGLKKIAADYALATGKSMGAEGLTEAGQQFFERMQAGLSLTDEKARAEYWDSLVGGAVLGGTLAPAGRYVERGGKQQEAKKLLAEEANAQALAQRGAAQQAAAQKAAEELAFKQSPEYALQKQAEYEEARAKMQALQAASKDPGKDADPVAKEEAKMAKAELSAFSKEIMQPLAKEYAELKRSGVYVNLAKQQQLANLTPMEAMMGQQPPQVQNPPTLGAEGPATTPYTEMATSTATPMGKAQAYAAQQIAFANERSLTPAKDKGDQVGEYTQYLLQDPVMATQLVQNNVRIPGISAKLNQSVLSTLRDTLKMQRAAGMLDNAGNRIRPQEMPVAQQAVESEEAQALEAARRAEEQQRIDAEKERQLAPEVLALQRIKNRPTQTVGLPGFGTAPEEKKGSAAIGQMEQSLRGVVPGQELLFTAEEAPTPAKAQKGPGGGFRLFNERGERQLTNEQAYKNLSERLAIALSNPDLSDDAYNFLTRAEKVLPQVDTRLETARKEPVQKGQGTLAKKEYAADVAASESFYKLLDEQLARVERGEEGVYQGQRYVNEARERARGTAAGVAPAEAATRYEARRDRYREVTPTDLKAEKRRISKLKNFPQGFEQPAGEQTVANVPGAPVEKRERRTSGRTIRGEAPALSMAAELEPLIRSQETARAEGPLVKGQKELFPSEAEKLGIQRANYKTLMNSPVVKRLREALDTNKKVTAAAKGLPQMLAQVKKLQAEVDRMEKINLEYSNAARTIQVEKDLGAVRRSITGILGALNKSTIESMQLEGRVEALQQMRGELIQEGKALGESVELPLLADLNENEIQLEKAQADVAEIRGALETLKGQLRVQEAKATLAKLNPQTVSKETLEAAKTQLRAAQENAGVAQSEIRKAELAAKEKEGKARREAEAVRRAEAEKTRIDVDKEYQRRLEAAYGSAATGREYDIITMAQREAQEMRPVAFTVQEQKKIMSNPNAVLAGYRGRIVSLERIMRAAYDKSKSFNDKKIVPLAEKVAAISAAYKNAKGADERARLAPQLEVAEKEYDDMAESLRDEPIVWKGRAGQLKELSMLYNKAEQLEADMEAGRIVQPEEFQRKSATIKPSAGEKAGAAAAAQATEVKEAKQRATAPATTGEEGVTRMKGAKLRKPEATVYSSKGVGQEAMTKDQENALNRIKEKQRTGKPLNVFEEALLARQKRLEGTTRSPNTPSETPRQARGVEVESPNLTDSQVKALENNDIRQALSDIAADKGTSKLNQVVAERLATMLDKTKVEVKDTVTDADGKEVLGSATSKLVELNRNGGLSQEILLHESTHAAVERVIQQFETNPAALSDIQRTAVRELKALHAAIKTDPRITSANAKGSVSEFAAEVFSNKNLQDQLRQKKWKLSDAWKGFKSIIMRMLGVKDPETMLGAALQSVDAIMIPSSQRMGGKETTVNRKLSAKDIAALHTGSNSMKQFAEQFGTTEIKQKDRTVEDANRIGQEYLDTMYSHPMDYVAEAAPDKLDYKAIMPDGTEYDEENTLHYLQAEAATFANIQAQEDANLRQNEARAISRQRKKDLRALIKNMMDTPEFTYVEQALVAKAASKFAVLSDKTGKLKLAAIEPNNRHNVAVVSAKDAANVIEELRAGKPLKQAFLSGMQKNADRNAEANESKNGWYKFDQSENYKDAERLSAACAGTPWCTAGTGTAASQLKNGDFYVYFKKGRPEVAVRMDGKDKIGELRGNSPNQAISAEQQNIAKEFLREQKFKGADTYIIEFDRKKLLESLVKNDPDYSPLDLLLLGNYAGTNGDFDNRDVAGLLKFDTVDGYANRPKPSEAVFTDIAKIITQRTEEAFDIGVFPGVRGSFSYDGANVDITFNGQEYAVPVENVQAISSLDVYSNKKVALPNLVAATEVVVYDGMELEAPKLELIDSLRVNGDGRKEAYIEVADNATINKIEPGYGVASRSIKIVGGNTIGLARLINNGHSLDISAPDIEYAKIATYDSDTAQENARRALNASIYKTLSGDNQLSSVLYIDIVGNASAADMAKLKEAKPILDVYRKKLTDAFKPAVDKADAFLDARADTGQATDLHDYFRNLIENIYEGADTEAQVFAINKKLNSVLDKDKRLAEKQGVLNAPSLIGETAPEQPKAFEETEQPRYAPKPKYDTDDALTQLASKIVAQPKTFQERLGKNLALEAEMEVVDMRAALREFTNIGSKAFNNDKQFTQAMASVLKADQYMPLVSASLESGPLEMYEDAKGLRQVKSSGKDSAVDVFKAIEAIPAGNSEGKFALASAYMIAQRALNKGLTALDLGALKVDQADLDAAIAAADANPKLKDALENAREKYNAYNAGQIKFLADTGYISKATAKEWLKDGDYVPYYRVRDDGTAELVLGGEKTITVGDVRHQPYLAELKGGETKILPLNESIMRNTMLITKAGMSNLAAKEVGYAMQMVGQGAGPVDSKTGLPTNKMAIHSGTSPGGPDIIVFRQEPNPKDPKDDGQRWVRVDTENTVAEGIPSALLVRSLEGAHLTLPAFLKIGGIAGDLLRKGITRMPPYILRQLYRDPMAASFTAGLNYGPFTAVAKAGKEFIASSRGDSKTNAELIKKGLVQSGIYTGDPDDMSAFALQLASGKDGNAINNFLAMLDRAAIRADSSTRALVYDNAIANGLSEVEADMMVMESMNFYKRGLSPTVQYANRLIPFMNAQIQGLNVLYKAATGKMPFNEQQQIKRKFYNNALLLFATGFAYAMAMEDDETFKNAKPRDKYTNFFVNLPGVDEAVKIAIPYEAGWFFSAAVAAVDAVKEETDGKQQLTAIRDMFLGAVPGYSSKFVPQAVKPLFEVFTNKSFFSGNAIESQSLQGKTPDQRFNASTTETAKMLAELIPGISPIQIDYLMKAYFGAAPILAMSAAGSLFEKEGATEKPTQRLSQNAVFGSMFQRKFGGADADVVYKLAQEATQVQTSFNSLKKTGNPEDMREYFEEHRAELAAAPAARKFISNMSKLKTQEDIITNRSNLSAEEKRQRLDNLDETRQTIAKQYMQTIKKIESQF